MIWGDSVHALYIVHIDDNQASLSLYPFAMNLLRPKPYQINEEVSTYFQIHSLMYKKYISEYINVQYLACELDHVLNLNFTHHFQCQLQWWTTQ